MKKIILPVLFVLAGLFPAKAQVTGLSGWNIFIDPGHSQNENVGVYGYSEAKKTVRVALALRDYLLNETDIDTVYLSRTNDQQNVSLTQRTNLANSLGAAWFHSIHSDASSNQNTNTTLLLHGGWRKNGQTVEKTPHGGKAMSDIMIDILTRGYRTGTRGNYADRTFYEGFPENHDRQYPYLHVNRESTMPSELSEAGFHTSTVQNTRNMNDDWKKLEARTMFWTFLQYHNAARPYVGIATGYITDIETNIPINGATVTIDGKSYTTDTYESLFHLYSTDPDQLHNGFYYIENLSGENLDMIVSAPGYISDTLTVSISDTFFTFKDVALVSSIPPAVISSSFELSDSLYPGKDNIFLNFNRKMNKDSVKANLIIEPSAFLTFTWANGDKSLLIGTDSLDYSQDYTLKILPGATDLYGNLFDGNNDGLGGDTLVINFRTKVLDQNPPVIVDFYPSASDTVDLEPIIRINFDEEINLTGISSRLKLIKVSDQSQISGAIRHYVIDRKSVVHFFPSQKLEPAEDYQFKIFAGIKDFLGNTNLQDTVINLTSSSYDYDVTAIDNFENGIGNWWQPSESGSTTGLLSSETVLNTNITNLLSSSSNSMQINYKWDPAASAWLLRGYLSGGVPREILFDKNYIIQVYVFGDGSKNKFRFALDDAVPPGSTHEVSPWYTIDWLGWKLVSWDMSKGETGTWLGDGSLDGMLRFDSFQLTFDQAEDVQEGSIYLDDLRAVKKFLVTSVNEHDNTVP